MSVAAPPPPPPPNAQAAAIPPPPPPMMATYAPAPAPKSEKGSGPMVIGLIGGLLAAVGALIGWLQVQSCVGAMGFNMCVTVPVPPSYAIGNLDAFVGIIPTLALAFGFGGLALAVVQKPITGLVAGVLGVLSLVMAVVWLARATPLFAVIQSNMGGASASVTVGPGIGLYVTIFGSLMLAVGGLMQWKALKARAAAAATPASPSTVA